MITDGIVSMRGGQVVGEISADGADEDDLLAMIISGRCTPGATPGPGAVRTG